MQIERFDLSTDQEPESINMEEMRKIATASGDAGWIYNRLFSGCFVVIGGIRYQKARTS